MFANPCSAVLPQSQSLVLLCKSYPAGSLLLGLIVMCLECAQCHALPGSFPDVRLACSSSVASTGEQLGSLWVRNPTLWARSILHT